MILVDPHLIREDVTEKYPDTIWVAVTTDAIPGDYQKRSARFAARIARIRGFKRACQVSGGATVKLGEIEYRTCYILTGGIH